ncbi:MAG: polyphosphate kinase 1 [Myxococcales bacterium]|nr:polyphosphate kinase 1 [Myxococcales bacterium]
MTRKDGRKTKSSKRNKRTNGKRDRPASPQSASGVFLRGIVDPRLYINRELALLAFNRRVLAQAADETIPLLERLFFVTICSTNMDEFFEVRVGRVKQEMALDLGVTDPDGLSPRQTLEAISREAHQLVDEHYGVLNDQILPALDDAGIRISRRRDWTDDQRAWARGYFSRVVLPVLTPMGLDPAHPFPNIQNKILNFVVTLEGRDAFGRDSGLAVVQVPRSLPRLIEFPPEFSDVSHNFVLLSSVIHANADLLFPGMKVTGCHQFRVTRNSDLWVDEEEIDDLKNALEGELVRRPYGDAVRLEVVDSCPEHLRKLLLDQFELTKLDVYAVDGPVNLHRLQALVGMVDRSDLKSRSFLPGSPAEFNNMTDIFEVLRRGDVMSHQPFQGFAPVLELLRQAADDPDVLAIKMTVYRTGKRSPAADILVEAARAGKEVTAVIELRARFDERANIELASKLHHAGATVAYGVVGHKTHCKLLMVVRREGDGMRRYVHLGTGNYHSGTAKAYTDIGYMSARPKLCEDVHKVFMQLTGLGQNVDLHELLQAPFSLHTTLCRLIDEESERARDGKPAHIIAKMNSLTEPTIIQKLYDASQAGVEVDLIVRGICCLRPGIEGVSGNIRVRSIVGRFLEHTRIYHFHAGGERLTYCASADWMGRNFFRRVETCWPIADPKLVDRLVEEGLLKYLRDNTQAWLLQASGEYVRATPQDDEEPYSAQSALLKLLAEAD